MSGDEPDVPFLSRWSKRKVEARQGIVDGGVASELPPIAAQESSPARLPDDSTAGAPQAPLPTVESLDGLRSQYEAFMQPQIDDQTKRAALKKLFADPHFNKMDGLDVYIDDYSQFEPIPTTMLRALNHAKDLLFRDDEKAKDADATSARTDLIDPIDPIESLTPLASPQLDTHQETPLQADDPRS